jgi:hemerythrin
MAFPEERCTLALPEMEAQHKYLYQLFDKLESGTTVQDPVATKKLLEELERYVLFHFSSEEFLMRSYKVPSFAVHQSDHEQAGARFVQFLDDFDTGKLNPAALRIFLTGWLMEHSRTSDAEYVSHIIALRSSI